MNAAEKSDRWTENNEQRREIVFSLRPAQIVGGMVVLCLGYAAVFFLGVVLGRGYAPESGIPELARLMPEASAPVSPRVVAPQEEKSAQEDTASPSAPPPGGNEDTPFTQADLDYRERLKSRPHTASSAQGAGRTGDGAGRSARGNEKKADGGNVARTRDSADVKTPRSAAVKADKSPAAQPARASEVYHYVYQVASYKDRASGDNFAKRLRAAGFKVRTEQSTGSGVTWFRTMVEFTGRPDDTDALREKLKGFGVPRALLKSKTPAN
ncbi:MAG: SPOR domain-containing protein [Desulfovibrio sp.]|jgi:cell division protein FtsN|nr:SPOR domain-containing protein [Desulfovibrio sp.]